MPTLRHQLSRLGPLALALFLCAAPALAGNWHPLRAGAATNQPASLTVTAEGPGGLVLEARFPGFRMGDRKHPLAGDYVAPEMPGCGVSETVGAPELPVLRRLIAVPDGAGLKLEIQGSPFFYTVRKGFAQAFYPRQRPRLKGPQSPKLRPFDFNVVDYSGDRFTPEKPCRLTEAGTVDGRRLVLVEVFPAAVNPITQGLRLYPELTIGITFAGTGVKGPTAAQAPSAQVAELTVNTEAAAPAVKAPARLLVIGPGAWFDTLAPYIVHRESSGWVVDTLDVETAGSTAAAVRTAIQGRYLVAATKPDAILLLGDVAQVPCFTGTQVDNPDTDLYYGCMDGAGDWQPELPVGRLSVPSEAALGPVAAKIIATETAISAPWVSHVAFMAGEDNHAITEATHNAVINGTLEPKGYASDKFYSQSRNATPAQVKNAFNEGRVLGIYSGHGDTGYWADGPAFYKSDVQSLTNLNRYPMIFSFACLTGKYSLNECFAETWLRQPEKAACGIVASSVTSYWDEDDVFERQLFDIFFNEGIKLYGNALMRTKFRLIEEYGLTSTVRRYFEQYNLFGDPSSPLKEPTLTIISSSPLPTGRVGKPYSATLRGTGGRAPYAWTTPTDLPPGLDLDRDTGILSGTPLGPADNLTVRIRLTDADQTVTTGDFRLDVTEVPLVITGGTNAGPFAPGVPFSLNLTAKGGVGPYRWDFLAHSLYESLPDRGAWVSGGKALNRQADERSWKLNLPWAFRFFESAHTSVWINSNGYLDFGSSASQWDNSLAELALHPRIAPLWDDLRTTNIYVKMTSNKVAIRWTGKTFYAGYPVDFEAILKRSGSIIFVYRTMGGKLSPTIGISGGPGSACLAGRFNGAQRLVNGNAETFSWKPPLAAGVTLSTAGVLSGTAAAPLVRTTTVVVEDQSVPSQRAEAELTLTIE